MADVGGAGEGSAPVLAHPRVELWHGSDQGDPFIAIFYLPKGTRPALRYKAYTEYGQRWLTALAKQGWEPHPQAEMVMLGPFLAAVRSHPQGGQEAALDLELYELHCRFVRRRPQLISLDEAEIIRQAQAGRKGRTRPEPVRRGLYRYLQALSPRQQEEHVRQILAAPAAAQRERRFQAELDKMFPQRKKRPRRAPRGASNTGPG